MSIKDKGGSLISIIVPVYNSEKYLSTCVESIIGQSYPTWELILVDDGSTDSSGLICDRFAKEDLRIKVVHKLNGGVGAARNTGLDNAVGDWIVFVDSDDFIQPTYLDCLLGRVATNKKIDLVVSFPEVLLRSETYKLDHYSDDEITQNTFEDLFIKYDLQEHTSPWGKLFRSRIIRENNIRFDESMLFGEDTVFLYTFLQHIDCASIVNKCLYCYRGEVDGSLSKRINTPVRELYGYKQIYSIVEKLKDEKLITQKCALLKLQLLIESYIWRTLNSLYHNKTSRKERMRIISSLDMSKLRYDGNISDRKSKYLKFLLKHKMFYLYDALRMGGAILRGK